MKAPRKTPDEIWAEFDRVRVQVQKEVDAADQSRKGIKRRKHAKGRH